jgi:hypothetical protein
MCSSFDLGNIANLVIFMLVTFLSIIMCQGDSLVEPLFVLTHFYALHYSFGVFLFYFFLFLANGIHIFELVSIVFFSFDLFNS